MWETIDDKAYQAGGETVHILSERLYVPYLGWLVRSTIISPRGVAVSQVFVDTNTDTSAHAVDWEMPRHEPERSNG